MSRVVSLEEGIVMVVTDLHGNWPLYERYRDVFLHLRERRLADILVFTGDLIHSEGSPEEDRSLEIVCDLIELGDKLGKSLVVLLGNHEMPHIYHVPLIRGEKVYTPSFEIALNLRGNRVRERVHRWLRARPFFVCTKAGVALCHAGAFPEASDPEAMATLQAFSHEALIARVEAQLPSERRGELRDAVGEMSGVPYESLARSFFGAEDASDPHYDDYLRGVFAGFDPDFKLLWAALFSRNEHEEGMAAYQKRLKAMLAQLEQSVMVTGHIGCRDGYRVLAPGRQLRLASGEHAHPRQSARYLLFDAAQPIRTARELLPGLGSIFMT